MVSLRLVGTCAFALLATGCWLDVNMGLNHASGGASGYGWQFGLTGGVAFDIVHILRPNVGMGWSMMRAHADDGHAGQTGFAYHARADVSISGAEHIDPAEIAAAHPGMDIPEGGADARTRLVFDYGWGKYEKLYFKPDNNEMVYEQKHTTHELYLGIAREYDVGSVQASFSIGPSVLMMPNDFFGDTTAIGVQFHPSFWFVPVFRPRESKGSFWEHYSGPSDMSPQTPVNNCTPQRVETCSNGPNGRQCTERTVPCS